MKNEKLLSFFVHKRRLILQLILVFFNLGVFHAKILINTKTNDASTRNGDTITVSTKRIIVAEVITRKIKTLQNKSLVIPDNQINNDIYKYKTDSIYKIISYIDLKNNLTPTQKQRINSDIEKIVKDENYSGFADIKKIILISITLIFFSVILLWGFLKKDKKNLKKNYDNILENLKTSDEKVVESNIENISESGLAEIAEVRHSNITITDNTLKLILAKLSKFEKSQRYLRQDMSLSGLASYLDTNTKYLSEILKQYKGKKFSDYINGLRINYIMEILYKNPTYREYKISYLAESCGFASREVFAVVFKKETGISPSYFINSLKKDPKISDELK